MGGQMCSLFTDLAIAAISSARRNPEAFDDAAYT
jgi:hypothetical protein